VTLPHAAPAAVVRQPQRTRRCRMCGNPSLVPCVSLGRQYLSSVFPETLDYRDRLQPLPLELTLCAPTDGRAACGLLQLAHDIDLSAMYEAYPYTSASNSSMRAVLADVAASGRAQVALTPGDVVLDVGCNDGTLLSCLGDTGCDLLGIDAAKNVAPAAPGTYRHVTAFFSRDAYARAAARPATLIFSVAMFYHLADPVAFARELAACLADDGVLIVQMAYLPAMLRRTMYDNIVHEHAGYYAVHQLQWLMEQVGLEVFDVTLNDVYGGSFRAFVKHRSCTRYPQTDRYRQTVADEQDQRLWSVDTYTDFAGRIDRSRQELRRLCGELAGAGKTIWIYGASTKGNTILQYCGLGRPELTAAADSNPFKIGRYVIGADVPITDESAMRAARPDYLLALPYSFVSGFLQREADLVAAGTRFIVPLPSVHVVPDVRGTEGRS
jgi:NDP-4-keto-2,6-dideoxyhexose 3-C-methyltransferase